MFETGGLTAAGFVLYKKSPPGDGKSQGRARINYRLKYYN